MLCVHLRVEKEGKHRVSHRYRGIWLRQYGARTSSRIGLWWVAEQDGTHMVYCAVSIVFGPSQRCLRLLVAPDAFSPRLCLPDLPARVVLGGESLDKPRLCRERVLPTATPTQRLQRSAGPSPVDSNPVLICRTRWARSRRAGVAGAHQREKRRHALFGHGSVTRNVYGSRLPVAKRDSRIRVRKFGQNISANSNGW